jgi:hypothetical protein
MDVAPSWQAGPLTARNAPDAPTHLRSVARGGTRTAGGQYRIACSIRSKPKHHSGDRHAADPVPRSRSA